MKFKLFTASVAVFGAVCAAFSLVAEAQTIDPSLGRNVAEKVCSECHQIDSKSVPKNIAIHAPSFVAISHMPSTNELAIKVFLRSSHNHMPNIVLSRDEIDSLAAYITGLAKD